MKKINNIELSYFAGFFDGEGSVTIHLNGQKSPRGKSPNHTLQVSIGNTDPKVLIRLKQLFGGSLYKRNPTNPNWREISQWTLRAKSTLPFLEAIQPFILMKNKQVNLAIKFQKTKLSNNSKKLTKKEINWRENQRIKIRKFNSRGIK